MRNVTIGATGPKISSVRTRARFSQVRLGDWTPIDDLHFDGVPPFDADDHGGGRVSVCLKDRIGHDLTREQLGIRNDGLWQAGANSNNRCSRQE